ncbi:MAG: PAS domain S-box protein [Deltaproteobacteria bacterium]|nr:PAS domain S-box protein [Deltaproteobacteria bacterium]
MEYTLPDLIDVDTLQTFLDGFNDAVGLSASITHTDGEVIIRSRMQPICKEFHRKNEPASYKCIQSDNQMTNEITQGRESGVYSCLNGLTHAVSAIRIAGRHVANIFFGQFLLAPPDMEFFRSQAARYGFDETRYLDALMPVPIVDEKRLPQILSFLVSTAGILGEMGLERLKQRETERSLREAENLYHVITENMHDAVWIMDMNLRTTWVTPSVLRNRGYSLEEITAMPLEEHLTPASLKKVTDLMATHLTPENLADKDHEIVVTCELEYTLKGGGTVWGDTTVKLIRDKEGKASAFLCTEHDITNWKRTEAALRESEERFRSIIQSSSDIIMILDEQGILTYQSPSAERILGYPPGYFVGRSPITMVHPDDIDRIAKDLAEVIRSANDGLPSEFRFRKADGDWITLEALGSNQLYNPGIRGIVITARDITERKSALEAVRAGEERFRLITENTKEVIWMMDMNLRFTYINPYIEHNLGYTPEEYLTKTLPEVMTPSSVETCMQLFAEELENERRGDLPLLRSRTIEVEHIHRNGNIIWAEIKMTFIRNASGQAVGILGFTRDISERKQLEAERQSMEERLRRAEKMEALGTLAGGVAHDLNNVLGVLVGYSELLMMEIPEGRPLRSYVSDILQSSERAAAIIQDLLTLARRGVAVSKVVNLNDIVSACLDMPEFEKLKGYHPCVTFNCTLGKDLLNVKGSPIHLNKTVMNLVSNAAEAIADRGEVAIVTENRYLDKPIRGYDEMRSGEYATMRVSDTGRGISTEDMGKIFEPFYTKKVMGRSGTGLGLAVVWGTVKDHDGYIDVESDEGAGSTFTIYLPITREGLAVDGESVSPETYRSRGESILVVDDIKEQRELAMNMLGRLGYRVATASGGEEAVEYLRTNRVDLLVLDMIMEPGIDGLETYRGILELHPRQKAILVSGFSETERVKETQRLGAGAYVRKPYLLEKIGLAVRNELDRPSS